MAEFVLEQVASEVQRAINNALNPDTTLTESGKPADAKAVGDAFANFQGGTDDYTDLSNKPSINGVELSGNKTNADLGISSPTDEQVASAVSAWLDEHPEATSTVEDGSISEAKLADGAVTPQKMADGMFDAIRTANLFNPDEHYLSGKKLRSNGVTIDDNAEWDVIYMVPVEANKSYVITPSAVTVEGSTASSCYVYFYDSDKAFISSAIVYVSKCILGVIPDYVTPEGTAFVSVNIYHQADGANSLMIVEGSDYTAVDWDTYIPYCYYNLNSENTVTPEQVVGLGEFVDGRTAAFETKENAELENSRRFEPLPHENLIDYDTNVRQYTTMAAGGYISESETTDLLYMLPVKAETTYSISASAWRKLVDDRYVEYEGSLVSQNAIFFDADGNRLSYVGISGNTDIYKNFQITTPANCAYMCVNFLHYDTPTVRLIEGSEVCHMPVLPYYRYKLKDECVFVNEENIPWIKEHIKKSPMFLPAKVNISAHRGDMESFPENTIPAFENAGKKGVWGIETDVYPTSDGVLMCLHDATVDRTTNGEGNLSDMTYEQAIALNIDYGANVDDYAENPLKIPTFAEYLKVCKKYGCVAVVHLQMADETYIAAVYEAVKNMGMLQSVIFVSWAYADVRAIREIDSECCVAVAYYGITSTTLDELERLGGVIGVHALSKTAITEEVINEAHSRGIYVFSGCDTNSADELEYWYNLGVDNIVHSFLNLSIL